MSVALFEVGYVIETSMCLTNMMSVTYTCLCTCLNLIWNAMTEYQEEGLFSSFIASEYHTCCWRSLSTCLWLLLLFKLHFGFVLFLFAQGLCFIFYLFADMSSGLKDSQPYCQVDLIPKYGELFSTYLFLIWLRDCRIQSRGLDICCRGFKSTIIQ